MKSYNEGTFYFISDIHLGLSDFETEREKESLLVRFLDSLTDAKVLFIIGDLYDYWFEYRRVYQKGFFRLLNSLYNLRSRGTEVVYLIGNHDFMHRDFFETEIGATMIENQFIAELNGKKFFMAHGDGLLNGDYGYKLLKKVLRNKKIQWLYSLIHPDIGINLAGHSSKTSRQHTSSRTGLETDGLKDKAEDIISKGFDYVIFGHTHRRLLQQTSGGYYVNLGTWLDKPCYGKFENTTFMINDLS
ncbi:MAG: UDP-2,3-diacylglucosamine hydrolase [Ignavibacteriales bacterium]